MVNDDAVRCIDALLQVGLRLARSAPSGRVLLARIAGGIDLRWIPRPWGEEIAVELASAQASAREPVSTRRHRHRDPPRRPPPDDVLVLPDGRLAVLDFGAWCEVDRDRVILATAAFDAFAAHDVDAFARAAEGLGWLPADRAAVALDVLEHALRDLAGKLAPQDLWPARGVAQLFATIARVGATRGWRELIGTALRDGWATMEP